MLRKPIGRSAWKLKKQSQKSMNSKGNENKAELEIESQCTDAWKCIEIKGMIRIDHTPLQRKFESEYPWNSNGYKTPNPKSREKREKQKPVKRVLPACLPPYGCCLTFQKHQINLISFFLGHSMFSPQQKFERKKNTPQDITKLPLHTIKIKTMLTANPCKRL